MKHPKSKNKKLKLIGSPMNFSKSKIKYKNHLHFLEKIQKKY